MGNTPSVTLDFSTFQPLQSGAAQPGAFQSKPSGPIQNASKVTLDFSTFQPLAEDALTKANRQMTAALSGQTTLLSPEEKAQAEAGKAAGFKAAALTAAGGALAGPLGASSAATEQIGTGILDASGQEIMKDVVRYGPSVARQVFSHPLAQTALRLAGGGAILKWLGLLGKAAE